MAKRYFFNKGFAAVPFGKVREVRKSLTEAISPGNRTVMYNWLRNGVREISKTKYDEITKILKEATGKSEWEIWETIDE